MPATTTKWRSKRRAMRTPEKPLSSHRGCDQSAQTSLRRARARNENRLRRGHLSETISKFRLETRPRRAAEMLRYEGRGVGQAVAPKGGFRPAMARRPRGTGGVPSRARIDPALF